MIIKTKNAAETRIAGEFRDNLRDQGGDVYVIPDDVMYFFVTLNNSDAAADEPVELMVQSMYECDELDRVVGFGSCKEAYDYARKCAFYAGLGDDGYEGDVYDNSVGVE